MPEMFYEGANTPASRSSSSSSRDPEIFELSADDVPDMMELTALTKPGPFNSARMNWDLPGNSPGGETGGHGWRAVEGSR